MEDAWIHLGSFSLVLFRLLSVTLSVKMRRGVTDNEDKRQEKNPEIQAEIRRYLPGTFSKEDRK